MNEKFFALPEEKRRRIVNAAMEAFGKNEYKRASTDDIAARAGISKGLLFHYLAAKRSSIFICTGMWSGWWRSKWRTKSSPRSAIFLS